MNDEKEELLPRLLAGTVLGDMLRLHMQLNDTCDKKANFTLGISGIILIITLTKMVDIVNPNFNYDITLKYGFIITIFLLLISAILCVYSLKPKIETTDRLNLFYYGSFCNKITREQYGVEIKNILKDRERIIEQYTDEIYDLGKHDLMPRFKTVELASKILIFGLIIGTITILIYLLN